MEQQSNHSENQNEKFELLKKEVDAIQVTRVVPFKKTCQLLAKRIIGSKFFFLSSTIPNFLTY